VLFIVPLPDPIELFANELFVVTFVFVLFIGVIFVVFAFFYVVFIDAFFYSAGSVFVSTGGVGTEFVGAVTVLFVVYYS